MKLMLIDFIFKLKTLYIENILFFFNSTHLVNPWKSKFLEFKSSFTFRVNIYKNSELLHICF